MLAYPPGSLAIEPPSLSLTATYHFSKGRFDTMIDHHNGFVLWFTGLSGAGKTTLAVPLEEEFKRRGLRAERLDGDIVRKGLTADLGFTKEDRDRNIERVTFVAKLLSRNGVAVLCSFISPYRSVREKVRAETTNFVEVYVEVPLEEAIRRDVKGLYQKAIHGEIPNFTGISDPYEEPLQPEIRVPTHLESVEESVGRILAYLENEGYIPRSDGF